MLAPEPQIAQDRNVCDFQGHGLCCFLTEAYPCKDNVHFSFIYVCFGFVLLLYASASYFNLSFLNSSIAFQLYTLEQFVCWFPGISKTHINSYIHSYTHI